MLRQRAVGLRIFSLVVGAVACACSGGSSSPASAGAVGGTCTYSRASGTATITSIAPAASGVTASFTFVPTDQTATPKLGEGTSGMLLLASSGQLPGANILADNGIAVGSALSAVREELTSGACSPVVYSFPAIPILSGRPA